MTTNRAAARLATSLLGASLLLGVSGCELDSSRNLAQAADDTGAPGSTYEEQPRSGSLSFDLMTSGGLRFDQFQYVITRGTKFSRAGTITVTSSTRIAALIENIPGNSGYTVALSGKSAAPDNADCAGAKSFDIQPGQVTNVNVDIACKLPEAVMTPPQEPMPAPVPPLFAWLLGASLLALGASPKKA